MPQDQKNNIRTDKAESLKWNNLYKLSGAIALTLGILFLITAIGFILSIIWSDFKSGWYSMFQSNWLIVIFKLHDGIINIQDDPLHGLNILDILILVLFSFMSLGLSNALKKVNKIWPIIAFVLSMITITLFIVTQVAGRSTVMLSVLIFSFVMLRNKTFSKVTIFAGILASIFLFVGDLTVGINSNIITILFGIGYILLITWFFLIARTLINFGVRKNE